MVLSDQWKLLYGNNNDDDYPRNIPAAQKIVRDFRFYSAVMALNPCAALACLSLAAARLGRIGAVSSGVLYASYTLSSVLGATWLVKQWGAKRALLVGMALYVVYVTAFGIAVALSTTTATSSLSTAVALVGAVLGGAGSGVLWTAEGAYFTQAAEAHALLKGCDWKDCTATLSGIFAFWYLAEETMLHVSSYILLQWGWDWTTIFGLYAVLALASTITLALFVKDYPVSRPRKTLAKDKISTTQTTLTDTTTFASEWYKITAAWNLLVCDKKMKYLIGLQAVFGLSGAFVNSVVSGQVLKIALHDAQSETVGLYVSLTAGVAAVCSWFFGKLTHNYGKEGVMVFGNLAFGMVAVLFLLRPDWNNWTWWHLAFVYILQGIGRATFESTNKATFADFFPYEKEGAFANIVLQLGTFGSVGYVLTFQLSCNDSDVNPYCRKYTNGASHQVGVFEGLVGGASLLAIAGYLRARQIHRTEEEQASLSSELQDYRSTSIQAYRRSCAEAVATSETTPLITS